MAADGGVSPPCITTPGVLLRCWDGDLAVAFDPSTARTHLLSARAAEFLQSVAAEPMVEVEPEMQELVDGLLQAGLLKPQT